MVKFYYVIEIGARARPCSLINVKVYGYLRIDPELDFRILECISRFQISGFQIGFLDFRIDFRISQWIFRFQFGFLDFT